MPIESTITACGPGQIGSKFKTVTKACPSGTVTQSSDYDTRGCTAAPAPASTINNTSRCALMPDSCAIAPVAQSCPTGSHWSLLGSGIAHCVLDDPTCPWGTSLVHDSMGNPSCEQNTCPSNQVLQGDGKSCACGSGLMWNGSTCVPATPSCVESDKPDNTVVACSSGSGYNWRHEVTSCPAGPYGAPKYTYYWDASECSAPAPVTCTANTTYEESACNFRYGTAYRSVTTSCPYGPSGSPSISYGEWDISGCGAYWTEPAPSPTPTPEPTQPSCTPTSSTTATACGSGYTGTKYITTTQNCPSGSSTSEDTSGCGCANGGSDYPTCSPPYTPPPPPPAPTVTCGPWSHENTAKMQECPEMQEHEMTRTCSDGTVEVSSYMDTYNYTCW